MASALDLQEALLQDEPWLGMTHDRRKCFDLLRAPFVSEVLRALGLAPGMPTALCKLYDARERFFKHGDMCGPQFRTAAMIQGCALSVLSANTLFALLAHRAARLTPHVQVAFFIDDSKLRTTLPFLPELAEACGLFHHFDALTCQECNAAKCRAFASTKEARRAVAHLLPPGGLVVLNTVSLGYVVNIRSRVRRVEPNARVDASQAVVERIRLLPNKREDKEELIASDAIPKLTYGVELAMPSEASLNFLRTLILKQCSPQRRCPESPSFAWHCCSRPIGLIP